MIGGDMKGRSEEKARQYFDRPGFRRMLSLVWKRYEVLERIGGQIAVGRAQEEECEAINAFFGTYFRPEQSIPLKLEDFQQELFDSAFPYTIPELHQIIEGFPLLTKSEKETMRQEAWTQMFMNVREQLKEQPSFVMDWLQRLHEGTAPGYRTLLEQFGTDPVQAEISLQHAAKSLHILMNAGSDNALSTHSLGQPIRLPFLAVMATGDSHALDWKNPAGRLLYYSLRERRNGGIGNDRTLLEDAEELPIEEAQAVDTLTMREVYRSSGIADDDLSAIVHIYRPEINISPFPSVWTLRQIELMKQLPTISALYVVENPAVFSMLLDVTKDIFFGGKEVVRLQPNPPMLVCSSGPASAAALRLFRRIIDETSYPCPIFYSGDFDVKGLEMGIVLANRFPNQFISWRFDSPTYLESFLPCPNGPDFSQSELNRLLQFKVPWDVELTHTMNRQGHKIFQESITPVLIQDWIKAVAFENN